MTPDVEHAEIKRVERGAEASRILKSEIYLHAVQMLQDDIWNEFKNADPSDVAGLQRARLREELLTKLLSTLALYVETGERAKEHLSLWEKTKQRLGRKF